MIKAIKKITFLLSISIKLEKNLLSLQPNSKPVGKSVEKILPFHNVRDFCCKSTKKNWNINEIIEKIIENDSL